MYSRIKKYYRTGKAQLEDPKTESTKKLSYLESLKRPFRYDLINQLLENLNKSTTNYLEIGVRNPADNFDKINATNKISVDPGVEFKVNPVDYKLTSDDFFNKIKTENLNNVPSKFDVIFIDGLHLADQVYRDIINSLNNLADDGFIVLHDCNPPNEYFAREDFKDFLTPAKGLWNGTVWKAFYRARIELDVEGFCIDSDWGIGILRKGTGEEEIKQINPFYEFQCFENNRKHHLNLMSYEHFIENILNS